MKFCEAMDELRNGKKVTRNPWRQGVYFLMQGDDVKSYQPKISPYIYNEDIMVSDGWYVEGLDQEMKFCNIIPYLQQGAMARMDSWKEAWIYYDGSSKGLVVHSMDEFPFIPDFESFTAQDWIIIE